MAPFRAARGLLTTIPGIGPLAAAAVISEIGANVREYFPDAARLASRAGFASATANQPVTPLRPGSARQPASPAGPGRVQLGGGPPRGLPQGPLSPARHETGRLP